MLQTIVRERGWTPRTGVRPTHLFLDGGKAAVPDADHGLFLNSYVNCLLKGEIPSAVELRTPVFRLFFDLDVRLAAGTYDAPVFSRVFAVIQRHVAAFYEYDDPELVVCATQPKTESPECEKRGYHLVFPGVYTTADTALACRAELLPLLEGIGPFANTWENIVDACVFRANGLRMPWSHKGRDDCRAYIPTTLVGSAETEDIDPPRAASQLRKWMLRLSIRAFGIPETPVRAEVLARLPPPPSGAHGGGGGGGGGGGASAMYLDEFAEWLPRLDALLPPQFCGQRFTGLMASRRRFMLRSSARYCLNLGRAHRSNNVYFTLSREGLAQRCFCRCETLPTERVSGNPCKDFTGPVWPVPQEIIDAFFSSKTFLEAIADDDEGDVAAPGGVAGAGHQALAARQATNSSAAHLAKLASGQALYFSSSGPRGKGKTKGKGKGGGGGGTKRPKL